MVEINNQRKAFLDMLAWSEGTDNGRQKTRNHGYDVIVGGELFTDYSITLAELVTLNPKTQINRRRTLPASFPLVGCLPQAAWPERLLSEKVRTLWHCSRLRAWRFTHDWSWWYPSGNRPLQQYLESYCRALVMVSSSIRLTAWLQNSKKRAERSERLMYEQESPRLSPLWLSASSSACHGLLIITVITPLPTKTQRDKNAEELEADGNYWHADASAWCCCARCKIHEGVSWC